MNQEWSCCTCRTASTIHGQPSNAVVGQPISPAIDSGRRGREGQYDHRTTVTPSSSRWRSRSGPAGAELLGTTTVRAVNGVADFTQPQPELAGTYTLTATGGALTPDSSNDVHDRGPPPWQATSRFAAGSVHKVGRDQPPRQWRRADWLRRSRSRTPSRQPLGGPPCACRVGGLPSRGDSGQRHRDLRGRLIPRCLSAAARSRSAPGKSVTVTLDFSMSGRRSPAAISKLDEDAGTALLGIWSAPFGGGFLEGKGHSGEWDILVTTRWGQGHPITRVGSRKGLQTVQGRITRGGKLVSAHFSPRKTELPPLILNSSARRRTAASSRAEQPAGSP